ncbi:hypothetical protein M406DRAFT_357756 [Cryphonectria parasitica EP155]|uniref:TRF2-interacting telomeric protein/Rap1 C-terminal domain-containing protein n=1 Tax=Cryphonectria parasitica (strain ATCC 38755 / EP155) TaxID=660469 RepID=A0A9P4XV49_CRYP1|nr:uncharacterized protein M406DRAFT_357756 [Cryphonectria parasitica EP155]KAF3761491.1 hypothetical protein M406DRAFT_357756 [Cryphonectria parasitica EP155]
MTAPYQPLAELSSPAYRSSPPLVGLKRSRQPSELLTSDLAYPSSPSQKRRRLDKNTVIPPTPEEKLMTSRGQLRRRTPQDGSSPFKSQAFTEDEIVEVSSAEDSDGLLDEEIQAGEEADQLPTNNISRRGVDNPVTRGSPVGTGHEQSDHDPIQEDEASPARFAPRRWIGSTGKQNGNIVSPTGQNRVMRADNNTPNLNSKYTANLVVPDTVTSRAPVNGHAKKRTLPPQYQRHTISDQNNTVQPVPQTNFSALGRPSGFPPTRTADKTMPPSGLSGGYTPGIARQAQPTFSASAPSQISSGHKATGIPEKSNFELHALNAQFYHFQALGYSEDHIVRAQNASTCQRGPMIVALDSLAHGRGIPENEPGVWSQRDIDDLDMIRAYERRQEKGQERAGRGDNGREKVSVWQAQHRLESKHGKKMIEYRNQFLDIMNRTG